MAAEVAILMVTYNNQDVIGFALDAALGQQGITAEIHVWDNASRDATRGEIRKRKRVTLHEAGINWGFSGGNNRLLDAVNAPFILFLNPDTQMQPDCLKELVNTLENAPPDVAGVGPKLLRASSPGAANLLDSTGIVLSKKNLSPFDRGQNESDHGQYDQSGDSFGPSLACALFRREAVEALALDGKLLDEDYFAYYEDVDLAWRARRLGWRFLYAPQAICLHRRGHPHAHGPTLAARAFVNRYLLLIANEDGSEGYRYLWRLVPWEIIRLFYKTFTIKGFGVAWRMLRENWAGAWRKRRLINAVARGK